MASSAFSLAEAQSTGEEPSSVRHPADENHGLEDTSSAISGSSFPERPMSRPHSKSLPGSSARCSSHILRSSSSPTGCSSTSNDGSMPAMCEYSRSIEAAKEWIVVMQAPGSCPARVLLSAPSSPERGMSIILALILRRSSAAAASPKVSTAIREMSP